MQEEEPVRTARTPPRDAQGGEPGHRRGIPPQSVLGSAHLGGPADPNSGMGARRLSPVPIRFEAEEEDYLPRARGRVMAPAESAPSSMYAGVTSSPLRSGARPPVQHRPPSAQMGSSELLGAPYTTSPTPLRAPPQSQATTPTALRVSVGSVAQPTAQQPPLNHINLAVQLAQLNFGRSGSCSPAAIRASSSFGRLDSPVDFGRLDSPSAMDSPLHRPVRPLFHPPLQSSPAKSPNSGPPSSRSPGSDGGVAAYGARGHEADPSREVVIDISNSMNPYLLHYAS
jgi:hypothetical protein